MVPGPRGHSGGDLPQQSCSGTTYFSNTYCLLASEPQGPGGTSPVPRMCVEECRDLHTDLGPPPQGHTHVSLDQEIIWTRRRGRR